MRMYAHQFSSSLEQSPYLQEASTSSGNGLYAKMPDGTKFSAASFAEMKLSRPLLKACAELGYKTPTPIQVKMRNRKWTRSSRDSQTTY